MRIFILFNLFISNKNNNNNREKKGQWANMAASVILKCRNICSKNLNPEKTQEGHIQNDQNDQNN